MKILWKLTIVLLSLLLVSACSSTDRVQLNYDSNAISSSSGVAVISPVIVQDTRGTAPDWLGAIRGGFGNRLKTLRTEIPTREVVQIAFTHALKARGMMAEPESSRLKLIVDMKKFDCSQYVRREAHAIFLVSLVDLKTRQILFQKTVQAHRTAGEFFAFDTGIFAAVEDLRLLANNTLQEAIDKALDDPDFRSSLVRASGTFVVGGFAPAAGVLSIGGH